tara:strand:- start:1046 stop:2653 length:1608 start_codon:yes stop_codon:yes gene_type:complete
MSNFSNYQLRKIAQSLEGMGRYGDTQLVHVTPEEVDMLTKVGAGTINPKTGLLEFYTNQDRINDIYKEHGGDSEKAWAAAGSELNNLVKNRDASHSGGSNKSSTTVPTNQDDFTGRYDPGELTDEIREQNRNNSFLGLDRDGDGSMWTTTDTATGDTYNWLGQKMNIVEGVNDEYAWGSMDVDGDGSMWTANGSYAISDHALVKGKSAFGTALNVVGLVANPVAFVAGKAINNYFDADKDGSMFTTGGKFTWGTGSSNTQAQTTPVDWGDDDSSTTSTVVIDDTDNETPDDDTKKKDDEEMTYSDIKGQFGYNKFSSSRNGREFLNYSYVDGQATPTTSYMRSDRPFHIALSEESAQAYAFSEQASNGIEQMISQLDPDVMDAMAGEMTVHLTNDQKIALVVGDQESGFVEATYEANPEGYDTVMNDVANMLAYMGASGDAKIDAGFMGRVASAERFQNYSTPDLVSSLAALEDELLLYEQGTPQYRLVVERIDEIQREMSRRTNDGNANSAAYSVNAVTDTIKETANEIVTAAA